VGVVVCTRHIWFKPNALICTWELAEAEAGNVWGRPRCACVTWWVHVSVSGWSTCAGGTVGRWELTVVFACHVVCLVTYHVTVTH
jgi:hypothetical protein